MSLYVVLKSPVGLDGTAEILGVFTSRHRACQSCVGAGSYLIATVQPDRTYRSGTLLDVESVIVADSREFKA